MADEQQEGQKTLVSFIVGLLIGGMLVWAFSSPSASAPTSTPVDEEKTSEENVMNEEVEENDVNNDTSVKQEANIISTLPQLQVGEGDVRVDDQKASKIITLASATYPVSEGWIGVREYNNENLGYILGVARFSESQGLIPSKIDLLRSTTPGSRYAIVIFEEDGDFKFNLAGDVQLDQIFDTFTAQ